MDFEKILNGVRHYSNEEAYWAAIHTAIACCTVCIDQMKEEKLISDKLVTKYKKQIKTFWDGL